MQRNSAHFVSMRNFIAWNSSCCNYNILLSGVPLVAHSCGRSGLGKKEEGCQDLGVGGQERNSGGRDLTH